MERHLPSWDRRVAPLAGAWIEMIVSSSRSSAIVVAPLAGAWIEIQHAYPARGLNGVAPLAGAWIEIDRIWQDQRRLKGRTPRGCVD